MPFQLAGTYQPRGDQANAIEQLAQGIQSGEQHQVLLGVTGSGKTFTMAKVIEQLERPASFSASWTDFSLRIVCAIEGTSGASAELPCCWSLSWRLPHFARQR